MGDAPRSRWQRVADLLVVLWGIAVVSYFARIHLAGYRRVLSRWFE